MKSKIEQKYINQAEFLARGVEVLPEGIMGLASKLEKSEKTQKPLRIKLGMDPTRPDLHLGHTVVMRKLEQFQNLGHKIVLLIGGATAMIGDPSGKSETRPSLTKEQVDKNAKTYFEQVKRVFDISNAEVKNNADWLHKMKLTDLLKLASNVTVAQIMARDDFAKRYLEGRPIAVHEFFYPLMQAYDSVAIDADIELGGTDQRFNLLMGREIQSAYGKNDPQLVMILPLIEGTDGVVKMSKTYPEHCISITEEPKNMYGKLMSIPDNLIEKYFALLTDISNNELEIIKNRLNSSENPRNIKMQLAFTITKMYNGEQKAIEAQENFINVVQKKSIPEDIKDFLLENSVNLTDLLLELGFISSKSEAKRLINQGGVKFNDEKITDTQFVVSSNGILQSGKRNFVKVIKK